MNPLSIGLEPGTSPQVEHRGTGWRGIEAKEVELANEAARSTTEESPRSARQVERGVEVLALTEAPEIDRNAVIVKEYPSSSEFDDE